MAKGNVALAGGLKPSKKVIYLFAYDLTDFREYTGDNAFEVKDGDLKGKIATFTEDTIFVYCTELNQIRGLRNIQVNMTDMFRVKRNTSVKNIQHEIEICNFEYSDHIDPALIPRVLRELMAEAGDGIARGTVFKVTRAWPQLQVKEGDVGVALDIYGEKQDHAQIIFENGNYSGFDPEEIRETLVITGMTSNEGIKNYQFTNAMQLREDFKSGTFDAAFYDLH